MSSTGDGTAKSREGNRRWNQALEEELLRLVEKRGTAVAKAYLERVFEVHPKTIERKLRRLRPDLTRRRDGCTGKGKSWGKGEEERLADLLEGTATVTSIAQRLTNLNRREVVRTAAAVRSKLWRSSREMSLPGYKAREVAELLGVRDRQVRRWLDNGYLEAKGGRITEESVRDLLRHRSHLVPFEKLDADGQNLLECLGYRAGGEGKRSARPRASGKQVEALLARGEGKFNRKEVAMVMGVSVRQVRHWVEKGWLNKKGRISIEKLSELTRVHPEVLEPLSEPVRRRLMPEGRAEE